MWTWEGKRTHSQVNSLRQPNKRHSSDVQYKIYLLQRNIGKESHKPPTPTLLPPLPPMIPPIPTRPLHLRPRILNRHPRTKNPLLHHGLPKQPPPITHTRPQLLARSPHGIVLSLQLQLLLTPLIAHMQQPGAVDGPVAEGAEA